VAGRRATLGDTQPDTLASINDLGVLDTSESVGIL